MHKAGDMAEKAFFLGLDRLVNFWLKVFPPQRIHLRLKSEDT